MATTKRPARLLWRNWAANQTCSPARIDAPSSEEELVQIVREAAAQGLTKGSPVAILSPNRPEVLFALGANMVTGCRASALHPLGSVDDHAYVIDDAEL